MSESLQSGRSDNSARSTQSNPGGTGEPVTAPRLRTALATVCISGTLEDKLVAAASAGFDGVEIFEPYFVVSRGRPGPTGTRDGAG